MINDPQNRQDMKKWAIEQALKITKVNDDGMIVQVDVIETAKNIYKWVSE